MQREGSSFSKIREKEIKPPIVVVNRLKALCLLLVSINNYKITAIQQSQGSRTAEFYFHSYR